MSYRTEVLADSPTFVLPCNESSGNLTDIVGSKTATATGSPTYGVAGPVAGYDAVQISGTGANYFSVTDHADLDLGDGPWTIEVWYYRDADLGSVYETVVAKGTNAYAVGVAGASSTPYDDRFAISKQGVAGLGYSTTDPVPTGEWHLWAITRTATRSAGNTKVYKDGVEETGYEPNTTTTLSDTSSALLIGQEDGSNYANGRIAWVALYKSVLTGTRLLAHYNARNDPDTPVWTTPADTVSMSTTPELKFNSPVSAVAQHFYLELDTANTFNTGNLRTYRSDQDQTNWAYWNGSTWTAMPSTGLPSGSSGNEIRYTVTSALSSSTWYRRVRAGTLV